MTRTPSISLIKTAVIVPAAIAAVALAAAAYAQEPPPSTLPPEAFLISSASGIPPKEMVPATGEPAAPAPAWDGDKPFVPEMHAPQFPEPTMPQEMLDGFRPAAMVAFNLADVSIQEAAITTDRGDTLVRIGLDGAQRIVRLQPHSMRSEGARLVEDRGGGVLVDVAWPAPATYCGIVEGLPEFEVAASIRDGAVSMMLLPDDPARPTWWVQPLNDAVPGMPPGVHAIFRGSDVRPNGRGQCGVGMINGEGPVIDGPPDFRPPPAPVPPAPPPDKNARAHDHDGDEGGIAGDDGSIAVANVRCQIALDADFEYYQACGSSVLAVIYEMERVMNHVGLIYQGQVAIAYTETFIIVRTNVADPYNTGLTGSGMRDEFRNHWVANHAGVVRDVAHLFSNRSSTDGFIGFAYFAGICNNNNSANSGHCWSSTFWSTDIANKVGTVAHELGHVWNAVHCDGAGGCGIMNSSINGSWTFGTPSANLIIAHRDSRPCLDVWQNPCYVNWSWAGVETGSLFNPWNTIFEGLDACLVGGTLNVQAGNYFQNPNIFKAKNINALNGLVRIGN